MAGEHSFTDFDTTNGLHALQDRFSFNRRPRPPPIIHLPGNERSRVPLKQTDIQRRESRGGLRGIFTRNKIEQAAVSPVLEEPASATLERSMGGVAQSGVPRSMDLPRINTATTPVTPATPARPSTMSSRMNLRAKSQRSVKPGRPIPKSSKSSPKSPPRHPPRTSAAWDPPPLFQAYPQAIKHATLLSPTLSADAILRLNNHKRTNSLRDEISRIGNIDEMVDVSGRKADKPKMKHRRQISGSSKADWTRRIFILVTSGYLLQYAGDGSFDRLPEKILQLTRDSAAFASDVIPGKHWVLQISQAMDVDGTPAADSRSLLSRLAFRGADYRRTATSLLLVLNSANDMDSWMAIIKREIEALGGKKQVSETGKAKVDDKVIQLRAQPSHRYLVARDPDQFSNPASPQHPPSNSPWVRDDHLDDQVRQEREDDSKPVQTPSMRPSSGSQSMTNSVTSHDGRQLESLRDSNRYSHMSSGQRTLVTSHSSSPATSPTRNSGPSFDEAPKISTECTRSRPNASAINERRRSMQNFHIPILDSPPNPRSYRHSAYGGLVRTTRSRSPGPPNPSVPNASAKQHSTMEQPMIEPSPTVISLPTSARDSKRFSIAKVARKPPPRPLDLSRPLSPVQDSISPKQAPKQTPKIIRHRNSTFEMLAKPNPVVTDAPPTYSGLPSPTMQIAPQGLGITKPLPASPHQEQVEWQIPERSAARIRPPLHPAEQIPSDESTTTLNSNTTTDIKIDIPAPIIANTKPKTPRPMSVQVSTRTPSSNPTTGRSSQGPRTHPSPAPAPSRTWPFLSNTTLHTPNNSRTFPKPSSASQATTKRPSSPLNRVSDSMVTLRPEIQRLQDQRKALDYRRSMPLLNMPPPAPPPDCALPPLPPTGGLGMKSPVGVRGSVRL